MTTKNEKEVMNLLLFLILRNFQHYLQELVLEQSHQLQTLFFPQLEKHQLQLQHSHLEQAHQKQQFLLQQLLHSHQYIN